MSVDPEKAALALEPSKDRRIEDLERQVRFLEMRLTYLKAESLSSSREKVKVLNELRQFYPLDELQGSGDTAQYVLLPSKGSQQA